MSKRKRQDQRVQVPYRFNLDMNRAEDRQLSDYIDQIKGDRRAGGFNRAARDGLLLIMELRAGKVDLLLEMFPFVERLLKPDHSSELDDLRKQNDFLRALLLERQTELPEPPPNYPLMKSANGHALAVPSLAMPTFDDDDELEVGRAVSDGKVSGDNFLRSALGLNGMEWNQ